MQTVPGLRTIDRNNPHRNTRQGRAQTSSSQERTQRQTHLRPQANPGEYYVRPRQPQVDQQAQQMAQALSQFSGSMQNLGNYIHTKGVEEAEESAARHLQQLSLDEAQEYVETGALSEYQNPYFQEAFQRQYGVRLGLSKGRELREALANDFNPREQDVDEFISERTQDLYEGLMDSPTIHEGFTAAIEQDIENLRGEGEQMVAEIYEQDKLDGAYETMSAEFQRRLERASTPQEREAAIEEGYQAMRSHYEGNRELLGLSNQEQDGIALQVAERYARSGDLDVVEKILTDDRSGVGSILEKRGQMGSTAAQVLNQAEQNYHENNRDRSFEARLEFGDQAHDGMMDRDELLQWHESNPGSFTDAQVESLIRTNDREQERKHQALEEGRAARRINDQQIREENEILQSGMDVWNQGGLDQLEPIAMTNDDGELEMVPRDEIIENLERHFQNDVIPKYLEKNGYEEGGLEQFLYELDYYSKGAPDLRNEKWQREMQGITTALSAEEVADGEIGEHIQRGYTRYRLLRQHNSGMLGDLINDDQRRMYRDIEIGERYAGLDFEGAVRKAFQINQNPELRNTPEARRQYQEVEQEISRLDGFMDGWGKVTNELYVASELRSIAERNSWAGGAGTLDEAREMFKDDHEYINGHAVPTAGKNVPENLSEIAERKIQEYVDKHPDEDLSAGDLTIMPVGGSTAKGSGNWAIVDSVTANPLQDAFGSQFTLRQLIREDKEARKRRAEELVEGQDEPRWADLEQRDRLNPLGSEGEAQGPRMTQGLEVISQVLVGRMSEMFSTQVETARGIHDYFTHIPGQEDQGDGEGYSLDDIDPADATGFSEDVTDQVYQPSQYDDGQAYPKIPDKVRPEVREKADQLRRQGITKSDLDAFVENGMKTQDGHRVRLNPALLEEIRDYLPKE